MKKVLGLDLGIASIGWALINCDDENQPNRIIDLGSFCFQELEDGKTGKLDNVDRRIKRGTRRLRRRKVYRLKELRNLFKEYNFINSDDEFYSKVNTNKENILELKVKGLHKVLTKDELMLVLYNYMKYRGFKSNRKADEKASEGVMLNKIREVNAKLNSDLTISEYLLNELDKLDNKSKKYHNHEKEYKLTVERKNYEYEIRKLFDVQISYNNITEEFASKYIELFKKQRSFDEGPDGRYSKYGIDRESDETLISKMTGKCKFAGHEDESRAPSNSFSAKSFILLSFLNNLRFYYDGVSEYVIGSDANSKYYKLTKEAINLLYEQLIFKKEISYLNIFALLKMDLNLLKVKGLILSRHAERDLFKSFVKTNEIPKDLKYTDWSQELKDKFLDEKIKKMYETKVIKIDPIGSKIYKELSKDYNFDEIGNIIDEVATVLFKFKSDDKVQKYLVDKNVPQKAIDIALDSNAVTGTMDQSIELCKELVPLLKQGLSYNEAMDELGLDHALRNKRSVNQTGEIHYYLPEINTIIKDLNINLKNPVVKNTLIKMIDLINSIIKKYGKIDSYCIEFARELKKSFEERNRIRQEQLDNMNINNSIKLEILENHPDDFPSFYSIKKDDLIKYKLFKEQNGYSPYTMKPIIEKNIFKNGFYEVDHIIPYSISFDDSLSNKVLVEAEENQNKKNNTPLQYFKSINRDYKILENFIKKFNISEKKANNLLRTEIDTDFRNQALQSSSYIARLAKKIISFYLLIDETGKEIDDSKVVVLNGTITDKLKEFYGLKGKTHSYACGDDYKNQKVCKYIGYKLVNNTIYFKYKMFDKSRPGETEVEFETRTWKPKVAKKDKELSYEDKKFNDNFDCFVQNIERLDNSIGGVAITNDEILTVIEKENLPNSVKDVFYYFISDAITDCQNQINKKDRENDLHHALDAAVIATTTQKIINNIERYFSNEENKTKEFEKPPLPYPEFKDELLIKVYEKDINTLKEKLFKLDNYKNICNQKDILDTTHVLYPVRLPKKVGPTSISQETIYGEKTIGDTEIITKRISVKDLKKEDLENIIDKDGGNKRVYEIIKSWMEDTSKDRPLYPILVKHTKDGKDVSNYIKNVKINTNKNAKDLVKLGDKRYAENVAFLLTRLYKRKSDGKIFGTGISYYQIYKEKKNENVVYKLMASKKPDDVIYINTADLEKDFLLYLQFNRYALLEIQFKNASNHKLYYAGGFTGGTLELYSVIGDDYDIKEKKILDRTRKMISTMKYIKLRNISTLGYIS